MQKSGYSIQAFACMHACIWDQLLKNMTAMIAGDILSKRLIKPCAMPGSRKMRGRLLLPGLQHSRAAAHGGPFGALCRCLLEHQAVQQASETAQEALRGAAGSGLTPFLCLPGSMKGKLTWLAVSTLSSPLRHKLLRAMKRACLHYQTISQETKVSPVGVMHAVVKR